MTATKICPRCCEEKPLDDFYPDAHRASGLTISCKLCQSEKGRQYYAANRERVLARMRDYHARQPGPPARPKRYWRQIAERTCDGCSETFAPDDARQMFCATCGAERRARRARAQAASRKQARRARALFAAAEALANWTPPALQPLLTRPAKITRPRQLERPLLRFDGGKADYLAALKLDRCAYCGGPGGERDHIVPRVRAGGETGGKSTRDVDNLTGACAACNQVKRDQDLLGFLLARV